MGLTRGAAKNSGPETKTVSVGPLPLLIHVYKKISQIIGQTRAHTSFLTSSVTLEMKRDLPLFHYLWLLLKLRAMCFIMLSLARYFIYARFLFI